MKSTKKLILLSTSYLSGVAALAMLSGVGLTTIATSPANAYDPNYEWDIYGSGYGDGGGGGGSSGYEEYLYTDDSDEMTDEMADAAKCANSAKPTCASNEQRECWVTYEDIPTKKEAQHPTYIWRCVPKN